MKTLLAQIAMLLLVGASAQASPTFALARCADASFERYAGISQMAMGLSIYHGYGTLKVAHCGNNRLVTINETPDSPDTYHAKRVVVNWIADDQEQTFDDLVDFMKSQDYQAVHTAVTSASCVCEGNR